jgi:hypothetical protein
MNLDRGLREGGFYKLFSNPMALIHSREKLDDPSILEEAHVGNAW